MLTIQTLVGFAEMAKASTLAADNLERVRITRISFPLQMKTRMNLHTPIKPTMTQLTAEAMTEKKFWTMMMTKKLALDAVTAFEAVELDAIALLAETWRDNIDPVASRQLVQSSAQACLSFGKEKRKGKGEPVFRKKLTDARKNENASQKQGPLGDLRQGSGDLRARSVSRRIHESQCDAHCRHFHATR